MRLSELTGKEIVNISEGMRLSFIDECELVFDEKSGRIHSMLLPPKSSFTSFFNTGKAIVVHWRDIKKFGEEIIIVDIK